MQMLWRIIRKNAEKPLNTFIQRLFIDGCRIGNYKKELLNEIFIQQFSLI